ncbi:MAG: hypothetical protein D6772_13405 [Bacteroidetes bacterium]|nr:MAG: hypothetical protein D6772_13405 [Bacteroidota bacterium]
MDQDLRKQAKKKVEAKLAFYICALVFAFTTVVLLLLATQLPSVAFWLRLPIPIFVMVLAVIYVSAFGLPTSDPTGEDWKEVEIKKEMERLARAQAPDNTLSTENPPSDTLELEELQPLKEKRNWEDDLV